MPNAKTVPQYLAALPPEQRKVLTELRRLIKAAAPMAEEAISYGIPLYTSRGHLVGLGAFKHHCSLFCTNSAVLRRHATELTPFTINHTTIQFMPDHPLPAALVKKLVKARVKENEGRVENE